MPFICLRYLGGGHADVLSRSAFLDKDHDGWRRVHAGASCVIRVREPCGWWAGEIEGADCSLVCDGFIARPRRFDALGPERDLAWLARDLLRYGVDALDGLEGQYALCFIDGRNGAVIAARDRLGGQTVYWTEDGELAALASRSRDIARQPGPGATENPAFVACMFAMRFDPVPGATAFADVNELAPGGRLRVSDRAVTVCRPDFDAGSSPDCRTAEQWVDAFRAAFQQAVGDVLGTRGDAAVMLSGGLDSGPVLAAARDALSGGARRLSAVSWVLPAFPESDESAWIRASASAAGVPLDEFDGTLHTPFARLDEALVSCEVPHFNFTRGLLLECHRRAARRGCVMVLPAVQGDLLYAPRFTVLDDLIGRRNWPGLWSEVGHMYRALGLRGLYRDPALRYPVAKRRRRRRSGRLPQWLTEHALAHLPESVPWPPESVRFPNPAHAQQVLGVAMTSGIARENDYARRFGIERRDPFLSQALVGLMLNAPAVLSWRRGQAKWIMRAAMEGRIPESVRVKGRTGDLSGFIRAGFDRNRRAVREFVLGQDEAVWCRYVKREYMEAVLSMPSPGDRDLLVLSACIGYTLWRRKWQVDG